MPGSKKEKKNAKDSGGIAAAVTKQTAGKFATANFNAGNGIGINGGGIGSSANSSRTRLDSDASSPAINTPEIRPSAAPYNVNPTASPLLEALSTTSVSASTAPSMINEWARGGLAGSPGNLISLMGESPPTQPSSYEDSGRIHHNWAAQRAFMSPSPASPSPPSSVRRPVSFQMEAHYQAAETPPPATNAAYRRSSMHSPFSHARSGSHPPLPHQAQAHFYGAPDLDMTITPQSGIRAGERGYFFGFDRLPSSTDPAPASDNVVVAGYEGGLEVYSINKRGLEPLASLKGLRGGVHHAKILPWTTSGQDESRFPLIAVVLHGPVLHPSAPEVSVQDEAGITRPDGAASPRSVFTHQDGFQRQGPAVDSYQTCVHVYSLRTNKLVDVLLQAPKVLINTAISFASPVFQPPPPSGAFTVKSDGGIITVCSGITGECWIYLQLLEAQNTHLFACVGKIWTSLQQSYRGEVVEEGDKTHASAASLRPNPQMPILALNGRWIAYCPSSPSSHITLKAHVPVPILGRAPGLSTVTPPHLPAVTSNVDLPISDSMVNKIMRETTQELIQGAKWVGQQGLQAWNSYWSRSTSPQSQQLGLSPPQTWSSGRSPHNEPNQFPPTHGAGGQATPKEPGLVSILDAETLATSSSVHPLTTFATPLGCSFLSFSPSSLALFTASSKGDVQTVWDLFRIQHTRSSPLQATISPTDSTGPQVRQIAQFSRMTVARIVDVAWAEPQGERIAMVTERGTVHLLDMPSSAFMWPPPRRRKSTHDNAAETSEPSSSAVSIASGAFGAAYQAAKPFVTRPRRSSANIPAVTGNTLRDSATHGGRVIAASISNSLGKTGTAINHLRHTGENRVSLPPSNSLPSMACVTWVKGRKTHTLFAVGGGVVRTFPYKPRRSSVHAGKRTTRLSGYKDIRAPLLPDDVVPPAIKQIVELGAQEEYLDLSDREMEAGNTMTLRGRPPVSSAIQSMDAAIPQAEIESSAPYQPFHTDRRVTLCEYNRTTIAPMESVSNLLANINLDEPAPSKKKKKGRSQADATDSAPALDTSVWAFGQDMPAARLDLGLPTVVEDDLGGTEEHRALPPSAMERVMQYGGEEQIVVTTRRRRGARQGEDEDGFFEDDCEVLDFADQRV